MTRSEILRGLWLFAAASVLTLALEAFEPTAWDNTAKWAIEGWKPNLRLNLGFAAGLIFPACVFVQAIRKPPRTYRAVLAGLVCLLDLIMRFASAFGPGRTLVLVGIPLTAWLLLQGALVLLGHEVGLNGLAIGMVALLARSWSSPSRTTPRKTTGQTNRPTRTRRPSRDRRDYAALQARRLPAPLDHEEKQ